MARTYQRPTTVPRPDPARRNILITSALPYVNNEPHLGNIIGCVLSADVFARYSRLRGYNTLYVSGTDEYGTATETKAIEEGTDCMTLCSKYHALHKDIYAYFDIDFDKFGRTTTDHQTEIAQDIFLKLHANNNLIEQSTTQLYCTTCPRFLADRYVEGTCPLCKFPDARGDQCDGCAKLLNAEDLINPRCKLCSSAPEPRQSTHMFIDLPKLTADLEAWVEIAAAKGKWSANSIAVTRAWLKEGLKPRCITRDLKWGTPVPLEGWDGKVFYVWFDAPIGYPSITASLTDHWREWWFNPQNVQLYQFMGKDNVPFHTVVFPSSLIGTGEPWTMLHHVSTTEYLNYEQGKFSKSRRTGVFGSAVKGTGIDISVWRYYLLANRPESQDSDFSWTEFIQRNNSELLNNLGNFVNRVVKYAGVRFNKQVPVHSGSWAADPIDAALVRDISALTVQYLVALESVKLRAGLTLAMAVSARGNQYLQDNKIDNALYARDPFRCATVVRHALEIVYLLAALVYPYMPGTARKIGAMLNADQPMYPEEGTFVPALVAGHGINDAEYLFTRIDEAKAEEFRARFGGASAGGAPTAQAAAVSTSAAPPNGKKPAGAGGSKRAATKASAAADPVKMLAKIDPAQLTQRATALQAAAATAGEKVKTLKTSKAAADVVAVAVAELLAAKAALVVELRSILGE
ncbi:methionyl-tRNA synthetase [Blastocladiella britannica]|nr:methionyl-tRNA synthetase [Blastocladiella britannica]